MIGNREGTADPDNLPGSDRVDAPTVDYMRLSQESDRSVAAQKRDIRDYCADRDLELAGILNEGTGTSGFNETREKYDELQRLVRGGTSRLSSFGTCLDSRGIRTTGPDYCSR